MTIKKVGYLGPEASFTHLASKALFQDESLIANRTIPDALKLL